MNMSYLKHHGILGQKWGIRRYQNKDGSLTREGRNRYAEEKFGEFRNEGDRSTVARLKANSAAHRASSLNKQATTADRKQKDIERRISENKKNGKDTYDLGRKWMEHEATKEFSKCYINDINDMTAKRGRAFVGQCVGHALFGIAGNAVAYNISSYARDKRAMKREARGAAYQAYKQKYGNS